MRGFNLENKNKLTEEKLRHLINQNESEVLEFKVDNTSSQKIGQYVSALANSAAMFGKQFAYMVWGISDDKKIVGTNFKPQSKKVNGGEPFISWVERNLDPKIILTFETFKFDNIYVVALIIQMTAGRPVEFNGQRYIRSGSSIKNLNDYPEKERELWRSFDSRTFEREFAKTNCTKEEIISLLDIETYKRMLNYPDGSNIDDLINYMENDFLIEKFGNKYNITNLGAYTFAKDLIHFEKLSSHAIRVIRYKGNNKLSALADTTARKGVVVGFEGLLSYIRQHLPLSEETYSDNGQRQVNTDYPPLVIREAIANQIVHQDFSVQGSNPMVEIYDNRVEIVNPGAPINEPNRLLDLPPISRNEGLANLFKKMHLVESRGSGIDKIVITLEINNLPAPDISAKENNTVITLFEKKTLADMNDREKINAIFYHTARLFMENSYMTNQSVRTRFGLSPKQSAMASKIISLSLNSGLIKPYDPNAGNKFMQYIPFWAESYNEKIE